METSLSPSKCGAGKTDSEDLRLEKATGNVFRVLRADGESGQCLKKFSLKMWSRIAHIYPVLNIIGSLRSRLQKTLAEILRYHLDPHHTAGQVRDICGAVHHLRTPEEGSNTADGFLTLRVIAALPVEKN